MKSFKEYKKSTIVNIVPNYKSTFSELRPKKKIQLKSDIKESLIISEGKKDKKDKKDDSSGITDKDFEERKSRVNPSKPAHDFYNPEYTYHALHDRDDVRPLNIKPEHRTALLHYTRTGSEEPEGHSSSGNINAHLRGTPIVGEHKPEDVQRAADNLKSVFTKKNTNKIPLNMHSGVPRHVGESLLNDAKEFKSDKPEFGAKHKFSGFTSSSSNFETAHEFARSYHSNKDRSRDKSELVHHVINFHAKPGTVLSVVHHSTFSENEGILQPNTYHHLGYEKHVSPDGSTTIIHHMTQAD